MHIYNDTNPKNGLVPMVLQQTPAGERSFDIYSRLLKERIIFLGDEVNSVTSGLIVAQMLHLDADSPGTPIQFYINSPGGSVIDGLAIIDTMNFISSPVYTICVGQCSSMGALLLSQGEKGHRNALPNSRILIHQPLGGSRGQASDIELQAKEILRLKALINKMLAEATGQPLKKINNDTDRDYIMTAYEAVEYGIVDNVVKK